MEEIAAELLKAPDHWLDAKMKPYIQKWDKPPKALQVLEVLDYCVHGALASGMIVYVLELLLKNALEQEGTTYEAVVEKATWRKELG